MKIPEVYKKKQRFWQNPKLLPTLIGLFIISIMVFSVLGMWGEDSEAQGAYEYKGIKFTSTDYGWIGYQGDKKITLATNPKELENITINYVQPDLLNRLSKVYISLEYNEPVLRAVQEFEQSIKFTTITMPACTQDSPRCADMPLKTCKDATDTVGVIVFKQSNQTEVSLINNCLTIQGPELTKIVDKIVLTQL